MEKKTYKPLDSVDFFGFANFHFRINEELIDVVLTQNPECLDMLTKFMINSGEFRRDMNEISSHYINK